MAVSIQPTRASERESKEPSKTKSPEFTLNSYGTEISRNKVQNLGNYISCVIPLFQKFQAHLLNSIFSVKSTKTFRSRNYLKNKLEILVDWKLSQGASERRSWVPSNFLISKSKLASEVNLPYPEHVACNIRSTAFPMSTMRFEVLQ